MLKALVSIYKSPRREEMYLYVEKRRGLAEVPEALMERFGKPVHVGDMLLSEARALARANVKDVLVAVTERGFYLQMPPPIEDYMKELRDRVEQAKTEDDRAGGSSC